MGFTCTFLSLFLPHTCFPSHFHDSLYSVLAFTLWCLHTLTPLSLSLFSSDFFLSLFSSLACCLSSLFLSGLGCCSFSLFLYLPVPGAMANHLITNALLRPHGTDNPYNTLLGDSAVYNNPAVGMYNTQGVPDVSLLNVQALQYKHRPVLHWNFLWCYSFKCISYLAVVVLDLTSLWHPDEASL